MHNCNCRNKQKPQPNQIKHYRLVYKYVNVSEEKEDYKKERKWSEPRKATVEECKAIFFRPTQT